VELRVDELGRLWSAKRVGGGNQVPALLAGVLTPGLFVSPARLLAQSRLDLCKSSDQSGLAAQQSREILHQQEEQGL
jgi:hypothetical protein